MVYSNLDMGLYLLLPDVEDILIYKVLLFSFWNDICFDHKYSLILVPRAFGFFFGGGDLEVLSTFISDYILFHDI
jgi:hypothetical protein